MIIGLSGLAGSGKDFIANILVEQHKFVKIALADPLKRICQDVFNFSDQQLWGPSEERNKPDKRYFTGRTRNEIVDYEDARCLCALDKISRDDFSEPTKEEMLEYRKIYLTPRFALQQLGTNWGRNCYPDIWTNYTLRLAKKLLSNQDWQYDPRYGTWQESGDFDHPQGVVISDIRFQNEMTAVKNEGGKIVRIYRKKSTTLYGIDSLHSSEQEQREIPDSAFDYILNNQDDLPILQQEINEMLQRFAS